MRAVYAAHLAFAAGTKPEDVVNVAGRWPCQGRAPLELCTDWTPGRRSYPIPVDGHQLDVEVFEAPEGRLWETTWRHPHADDRDLHVVSDVTVGVLDNDVTASLVIRTVWARPQVTMPRFSMRAPRLIRDLLSRFEVVDAGRRLTADAHVLDAAGADAFVDELLLNPDRTRPVVFVADDPRAMKTLVDPMGLAAELAGMAHVFYSLYGQPAALVSQRLGPDLRRRAQTGGRRSGRGGWCVSRRVCTHVLRRTARHDAGGADVRDFEAMHIEPRE